MTDTLVTIAALAVLMPIAWWAGTQLYERAYRQGKQHAEVDLTAAALDPMRAMQGQAMAAVVDSAIQPAWRITANLAQACRTTIDSLGAAIAILEMQIPEAKDPDELQRLVDDARKLILSLNEQLRPIEQYLAERKNPQ